MIYICIPAHNEEQTVGVVLWKIRQVMADFPRDYQLLVVDDASTDKTAEVLAPYARVLPLTVVRTESRRGEGAATEMMLREAVRRSEYPKRDVIVTLQADFTQEPDELISLIKRTDAGADIVVGQAAPDPKATRAYRWARALALRVLGRKRIPEGVSDPFTSYRAYRVFAVKKALEERGGRLVHWSGWAGAAELLLATAPHARRVDTVDIVARRERMQRESRLEPWPALKAVWSLAREARPLVVATPAELDEAMRAVAAVRTSEVAAAREGRSTGTVRTQRGEPRRGTSEERGRRGGRREPAEGRSSRGRSRNGDGRREGRESREASGQTRERRPRGERQGGERQPRRESTRRERQPRAAAAESVAAPTDAVEAQLPLEPLLEAIDQAAAGAQAQSGEPAKKKRRRSRRRKKPAGEATGAAEAANPELPIEATSEENAEGDAVPEAGEARPRRRRRGRRGGRRRGGDRGDGGDAGDGGDNGEGTGGLTGELTGERTGASTERGAAEPGDPAPGPARSESVPVFTEGERNDG